MLPQVPEDLQKEKKTLSDKTKKKIAENNRKFSICKLCRYQFHLHSKFNARERAAILANRSLAQGAIMAGK